MGRLDPWAARLRCRSRSILCDGRRRVRLQRDLDPHDRHLDRWRWHARGWTVGAVIDYAFTNNWFTGIEYRYSQYESKSFVYPIPILNLGFVGFKQELSNNQVTARIGYKF